MKYSHQALGGHRLLHCPDGGLRLRHRRKGAAEARRERARRTTAVALPAGSFDLVEPATVFPELGLCRRRSCSTSPERRGITAWPRRSLSGRKTRIPLAMGAG
jgi:hypothetical protein